MDGQGDGPSNFGNNNEASWVVLEQADRFSPTQFLAFPFDSDDSGDCDRSSRENTQSHVTPALSMTNGHSNRSEHANLSDINPGFSLHIPNSLRHRTISSPSSPESESSETGVRMFEAEQAFTSTRASQFSHGSLDSMISHKQNCNFHETDPEIAAILQSSDNQNSVFAQVNRSKSASEQIQRMVEDIKNYKGGSDSPEDDFQAGELVAALELRKKERLQRQKERKRLMQMTENLRRSSMAEAPNETQTRFQKFMHQCRLFLKTWEEFQIPLAVTHVMALLMGVMVGKNLARK